MIAVRLDEIKTTESVAPDANGGCARHLRAGSR